MVMTMTNNNTLSAVDGEIYDCMSLDTAPKSFFLFAGAGSGKTRSLVNVLKKFKCEHIHRLRKNSQKIAIITYTNAACEEIKGRLDFDTSFYVSTIHSFAWYLIKHHVTDIRIWLKNSLENEISNLQVKLDTARNKETKTYKDNTYKFESKTKRLDNLKQVTRFSYNPNGDNLKKDSLNHAEVIKIATHFLQTKPLMQRILIGTFPILLIDESQDTNKSLLEEFFTVQKEHHQHFMLGLFGDTMQRIYMDGKVDLGKKIPDTWATPKKKENHRCPERVVTLINKIRSDYDEEVQKPAKEEEGIVRLFIVQADSSANKEIIEGNISKRMASITDDKQWQGPSNNVKVLTLEHHMAANRSGFADFFIPLYKEDKLKTGLLDGTLPAVSLFSKKVLPLIKSKKSNDDFGVSRIVRKESSLIDKKVLKNSASSISKIKEANKAVNALYKLWDEDEPTLENILKEVYQGKLFPIPEMLLPIAKRLNDEEQITPEEDDDTEVDTIIAAWETALKCKFSSFEEYVRYISDESKFGTHQGIKGLEFPRVMVVLDDNEAHGFLFSYEKLFGAKEETRTDEKNKADGKETSLDRTRRLFYVTCSRAEESLAIVAYTKEPKKVYEYAINQEWFSEEEIIQIGTKTGEE